MNTENANTSPVAPREAAMFDAPSPIFNQIDDLLDQTLRAFKLVIKYDTDCPEGTRWTEADIDDIYKAGKYLEDDRKDLVRDRKNIADGYDHDGSIAAKMEKYIVDIAEDCIKVQDLISERERLPEGWDRKEEASEGSSPGLPIKGAAAMVSANSTMVAGDIEDDDDMTAEDTPARFDNKGGDQDRDEGPQQLRRDSARYARRARSHFPESYRPAPYTKSGGYARRYHRF